MEIDLNELRDKAYKCACDHGFHEKEISDETYLMLIITEISEAVNADRKNHHAYLEEFNKICTVTDFGFIAKFEGYIKDSIEDEISDVVIRLLDFAGARGIDFEKDDILGCDNNFCGDDSFCEKCYYLCRLAADNFSYSKLEQTIKVLLADIYQLSKRYNIELFKFIDLKMKYNELRPYKNGKNY